MPFKLLPQNRDPSILLLLEAFEIIFMREFNLFQIEFEPSFIRL